MKQEANMEQQKRDVVTESPRAMSGLIGKINPYDPDQLKREGIDPIRIEESRIKHRLVQLFVVGFIGFAAWAVYAPIDGGANVTGTVVVKGKRKAVQHPTGGVVEQILVQEGDTVKQGDVLVRLNPLGLQAALNSAELDYINAMAAESRLISERENLPSINWLPELQALSADSRARAAKAQHARLFKTRKAEIEGQQKILREQVVGLGAHARQMEKVVVARNEQLAVMVEEATSYQELAAEGFVPRSRANEVERSRAELLASVATTMADIGKTQSDMAATQLQLYQNLAVFYRDLETQLAEAQKLRHALRAKVESLRFDLSLTEMRAPTAGIVVGVKVNTEGGVIEGGSVLMEIVPGEESLIVEAQVPPVLIDKIQVGLEADLRFSAFNMNTTPVVPGKVIMVGADRLPPTSKEQPFEYYLAQIETTPEGYELLGQHKVQAGMPVDVVIKTGERSFMSYLLKPLSDRFALAFKES